ncbi:SLAM family member 6 isoform X1 [Choloepus didactylus]|uniref:SLAM family member 6 isoform X1 n=1 Tax=Choloepus didactylus TaxID=27675 RepID=UPI00189D4DB8|nr:SLAM family member 6 isoform X1 [Choloepus didactylus]
MMWLLHSLMLVFCLGPGNAGSQSSSTPLMMNGILGETVTLPLKSPEGEEIKYITWLYNGMSIAFIKPSETGSPLIEVTDPKRRERLTFTPSYSLQLSNLTMADTGFYGAQITSKSSTTVSYYTLRIFRRLRKLQIDNHYVHFGNGTCEIHLTCSVENTNDSVSFTWHHLGKQISPSRELNITISLNPKNSSEHNYTCMAENPVSNLIISVSDQMYCKDNSFSKEKNQQLHIIWIMTVVPVICIMCWLLWKKRKGRFSVFLPVSSGFQEFTVWGLWAHGSLVEDRCLSFLYSASPVSCRAPEDHGVCFSVSREHSVCSGLSPKEENQNPKDYEKE